MAEAQLQATIIKALRAAGAYVKKNHQTGAGRRGIPDLDGCYHGHYFAVEVKQPGAKPTTLQLAEMRKVHDAGGWVTVATSVEEALDLLRCIEQGYRPSVPVAPVTRLEAA